MNTGMVKMLELVQHQGLNSCHMHFTQMTAQLHCHYYFCTAFEVWKIKSVTFSSMGSDVYLVKPLLLPTVEHDEPGFNDGNS